MSIKPNYILSNDSLIDSCEQWKKNKLKDTYQFLNSNEEVSKKVYDYLVCSIKDMYMRKIYTGNAIFYKTVNLISDIEFEELDCLIPKMKVKEEHKDEFEKILTAFQCWSLIFKVEYDISIEISSMSMDYILRYSADKIDIDISSLLEGESNRE